LNSVELERMRIILFVTLFYSIIIGCKVETEATRIPDETYDRFYVRNKTPFGVTISFYDTANRFYKKSFIAASDSVVVDEGKTVRNGLSLVSDYKLTLQAIDSAVLEFADGKQLIQTSPRRSLFYITNDILSISSYTNYSTKSTENHYVYVLKEAEYAAAK
jgi:hypothetical protein